MELRELLRRPVVVAPMAAGPTTPALVIAAAGAGALGFLAAGYQDVAAMTADIAAVLAGTGEAFGVNLFVPGRPADEPGRVAAYLAEVAAEAGTSPGEPAWDDHHFGAKVSALLAEPPPLVSFTFGCPDAEIIAAFRAAGSVVAVTVTSAREALAAAAAGAGCLCVQGSEAGAHRGTFANDDLALRDAGTLPDCSPADGVLALSTAVARVTGLPQIAAGGIMNSGTAAALLGAHAVAVQCGTAFLRCPESGTPPAHQAALADPAFTATAVTRAFSGRPARGLVNDFLAGHPDAPAAFPEINNALRPLRAAAATAGDTGRMSLWAGTGFREARDAPAAEIIDHLCPRR
jgi:nitronate monooxygenase